MSRWLRVDTGRGSSFDRRWASISLVPLHRSFLWRTGPGPACIAAPNAVHEETEPTALHAFKQFTLAWKLQCTLTFFQQKNCQVKQWCYIAYPYPQSRFPDDQCPTHENAMHERKKGKRRKKEKRSEKGGRYEERKWDISSHSANLV